jgi:uncharacterized protein
MLTPEDQNAIDGLFERLAEVERQAPPRDPEAERLIDYKLGQQPGAPYYLAQTVLVQERALELAQQRIDDLERQVSQRRSGGLFGGLFGDGAEDNRPVPARRQNRDTRGPWERQQQGYGYGGGGFLAGAAQTALGVTGGVLLGSAIASMFGAGAANAAEQPVDDQPADDGGDAGSDGDAGGGFGDDGGDLGGGDFDMGGDF